MYNLIIIVLLSQWHQLPGPYLGRIADTELLDDTGANILLCTSGSMSGGIYRSTNGGRNWNISASNIPSYIGFGMKKIVSSSVNHNIILCGTNFAPPFPNYIFRSVDGGRNWTQTSYNGRAIGDIKFSPQSSDTVLLVCYDGIYKSTNSGMSWSFKQGIIGGRSLHFKRNNSDTVFAGTSVGLLISVNQGETWTSTPFNKYCDDIVNDPQSPDSLYIASSAMGVYRVRNNGNIYDSLGLASNGITTLCFDRISRKIYGGSSMGWARICVSDDLGESWIEYGSDQIYDDFVNDIEVPLNNPNLVIASCIYAGICLLTPPDSIWQFASEGINEAIIRSIAVAPTNPDIIYISMSSVGVWRSTDGGNTWSTNPQNKTWRKWHITEYWPPGIAVSPNDPDVAFATYWFKTFGDTIDTTFYHAVLKTTDGGNTWEEKTNGLDTISVDYRIEWIATHPKTDDTLYLATSHGIFKSTDSGENWERLNSDNFYWVEVDPIEPNRLYATSIGEIYYSENGGQDWEDRSNGLCSNCDVMMVDVDPENNNIVYAALCGLETGDSLSGIYKSTDHGNQWIRHSLGLPFSSINRPRVMVDTINSFIWATTPFLGSGVFYSTNQGVSWYPSLPGPITNRTTFLALGNSPLLGTDGNGILYSENFSVAEMNQSKPKIFSISPNPCKGQIRINYTLLKESPIKIMVIDVTGRRVVNLMDKVSGSGNHIEVFNIDLATGVYFVKIVTNEFNSTGNFVLIH